MAIDATGSPIQNFEGVLTTKSGAKTEERLESKTLGQDEFFKLLTTQLASQDPLEPMEDTAFIAQMASFSQLEMTSDMTKSFDKLNNTQQFASAHGYIGKNVTLSSGEEGLVTSVERQNGETMVFLDGKNTDGRSVDNIYRVADATVNSARQVADAAVQAANDAQAAAEAATRAATTVSDAFSEDEDSSDSNGG